MSVSPTDGIGPTQGQRKTLTRVGNPVLNINATRPTFEINVTLPCTDQDDPYQSETKEVYADDPLADKECLAYYEEEMKMESKLDKKPTKRLRRTHDQKVYRQTINLHTFDKEAGSP